MYKKKYKTTKFIYFVKFKVQKSCLSMTIHFHSDTHIPNHCAHSANFQFPAFQLLMIVIIQLVRVVSNHFLVASKSDVHRVDNKSRQHPLS